MFRVFIDRFLFQIASEIYKGNSKKYKGKYRSVVFFISTPYNINIGDM